MALRPAGTPMSASAHHARASFVDPFAPRGRTAQRHYAAVAPWGRLTPSLSPRSREWDLGGRIHAMDPFAHLPSPLLASPRSEGPAHTLSLLRCLYPEQSDAELMLQKSHEGDAKGLEALLWAEAPANTQSDNGQTPLMLAVMASSLACVSLLLAAGADVNAADDSGTTALHLAAVTGDLAMVQKLCAAPGINVHATLKTADASTPLQLAEFAQNQPARTYLTALRPRADGV